MDKAPVGAFQEMALCLVGIFEVTCLYIGCNRFQINMTMECIKYLMHPTYFMFYTTFLSTFFLSLYLICGALHCVGHIPRYRFYKEGKCQLLTLAKEPNYCCLNHIPHGSCHEVEIPLFGERSQLKI